MGYKYRQGEEIESYTRYYYITDALRVKESVWHGGTSDCARMRAANVFETPGGAYRVANGLRMLAELLREKGTHFINWEFSIVPGKIDEEKMAKAAPQERVLEYIHNYKAIVKTEDSYSVDSLVPLRLAQALNQIMDGWAETGEGEKK